MAFYLHSLALENFKCFQSANLELSKFTILTGANSSGKSSLLTGLLAALQTSDFPFFFSPNGDLITLGDYTEIVYNHETARKIGVSINFADHQENLYNLAATYSSSKKRPHLHTLTATSNAFDLQIQKKDELYLAKYNFKDSSQNRRLSIKEGRLNNAFRNFLEEVHISQKKRSKTSSSDTTKFLEQYLEKPEDKDFFFKTEKEFYAKVSENLFLQMQVNELTHLTKKFAESFNFISPFRLPPERTYYQKTKTSLKVDKYGDNTIDQIFEWNDSNSSIFNTLNENLQKLGLASSLSIKPHGAGRYELRVPLTPKSRTTCSLPDVGFGVSQLLPILVADLQLPKKGTLAIAQPEIHLHPKTQAELGTHLAARAKESGNRYIIETHSEYLITRFRLLIAQGIIPPEDVSVYYISTSSKSGPKIHKLKFHPNGIIEGAPDCFFDTYMADTFEIVKHAH